jgi:hypothetical protein
VSDPRPLKILSYHIRPKARPEQRQQLLGEKATGVNFNILSIFSLMSYGIYHHSSKLDVFVRHVSLAKAIWPRQIVAGSFREVSKMSTSAS